MSSLNSLFDSMRNGSHVKPHTPKSSARRRCGGIPIKIRGIHIAGVALNGVPNGDRVHVMADDAEGIISRTEAAALIRKIRRTVLAAMNCDDYGRTAAGDHSASQAAHDRAQMAVVSAKVFLSGVRPQPKSVNMFRNFPGLSLRILGDRSGVELIERGRTGGPIISRTDAAKIIMGVRQSIRYSAQIADSDGQSMSMDSDTALNAPELRQTGDTVADDAEAVQTAEGGGDGTPCVPGDDSDDSGDDDGEPDRPRLFYPPTRDTLPDGAIMAIGQRVYCGLSGGQYGIVYKIDGQQSPASIGRMGGGVVTYGGRAELTIVFDTGHHDRRVPESVVRGVQWDIFDSVATTDEIIDAIQYAQRCADYRERTEQRKLETEAAQLAADMAVEDTRWVTGAELLAAAPKGATRVVVAELNEDTSDSMSDYHGHRTSRSVVIGFSTLARESFPVLRKAAALFPPTAHLAPGHDAWSLYLAWDHDSSDETAKAGAWLNYSDSYYRGTGLPFHFYRDEYGLPNDGGHDGVQFATEAAADSWAADNPALAGCYWRKECRKFEHRENYSMGGGNYLKDGHGDADGWRVESQTIQYIAADARYQFFQPTGKQTAKAAEPVAVVPVSGNGVTITRNTEKGGLEIRFPSKPTADTLSALKANGWRWSKFSACWWSKASAAAEAFAEPLAGGKLPEAGHGPDVDRLYEDQCRDQCGM
jgi:hypothetical protein